jgi:hypothetical protein
MVSRQVLNYWEVLLVHPVVQNVLLKMGHVIAREA